ncbi:response regulator [Pantanalinema sp. GBBB05]|uniref:response regulator n=1 Tax=Pantanalinema sp. GBBB05 TaxID=2604139 RepID=UPI001D3FF3AE|nr:response regulator [Pantanalinema sp. GBBB05]
MSTKRILVIDDEFAVLKIIEASLKLTRQWEVLVAESGKEGLAIAQTELLNAILLDVMMPGMNALAILKELQQSPRTQAIPVILLTATVEIARQPEYVQSGAKAVVIKPFDPEVLPVQIETALGWNS